MIPSAPPTKRDEKPARDTAYRNGSAAKRDEKPTPSTYRNRAAQRRRRRRRRMTAGVAVGTVLVAALLVAALLVGGGAPPPSSSVPAPVSSSQPAPVVSSTPEPLPPPRTPTPYDEAGIPMLCNRFNMIPDKWEPELVDVGDGQSMDRRAAEAYLAMKEAAADDGIVLLGASGYRSNGQQTANYNNSVQNYVNQGYGRDEAVRLTERWYAIPGSSEHEAGLAMDVWDGVSYSTRIDDSFAETEAFEWLQEHCTEYGFIYRYKQETEAITHIAWEPWHYRYVGANHAERIAELDLTLEEYVRLLIEETRAEGGALPASVPIFEDT